MGVYIPHEMPRFRDYAPSVAIPSVYWDVESAEQRVRAICELLGKVIAYADEMGIEVTKISEALDEINQGKIDPIIIAAIETWFDENHPEVMDHLEALDEADIAIRNRLDAIEDWDNATAQTIHNLEDLLDAHHDDIITLETNMAQAKTDISQNATDIQSIYNLIQQKRYIATIGDSFGNDDATEWAGIVASNLNLSLLNKCTNGAGFTTGSKTFAQQMEEIGNSAQMRAGLIEYVILYGGVNDWNDAHASISDMSNALVAWKRAYNAAIANAPAYRKPKLIFAVPNVGYARRDQYIGFDNWARAVQVIAIANAIPGVVQNVQYWLMCEDYTSVFTDDYLHPASPGQARIAGYIMEAINGTYSGVYRVLRSTTPTNATGGVCEATFNNGLTQVTAHLQGVSFAVPDTTVNRFIEIFNMNRYTYAFGSGNATSATETALCYGPIHQMFVDGTAVAITRSCWNDKLGKLFMNFFGAGSVLPSTFNASSLELVVPAFKAI